MPDTKNFHFCLKNVLAEKGQSFVGAFQGLFVPRQEKPAALTARFASSHSDILTSNNAENNAEPWGIRRECNVSQCLISLRGLSYFTASPGPSTANSLSHTIDSLSKIFSSGALLNLIPSHITSPSHSPPREHEIKMLNNGAVAVAIVRRQVMIVQAARTHTKRDKYLDVQTYSPFGERIFLVSEVPSACIAASDILSVFDASTPTSDPEDMPGMLELPPQAFSEYLAYSERQQKRYEDMWCAWTAKH